MAPSSTQVEIFAEQIDHHSTKAFTDHFSNELLQKDQALAKDLDGEVIQISFTSTCQKDVASSGSSFFTFSL